MKRALHTRCYSIGAGQKKSATKAAAYRGATSVLKASSYRSGEKIRNERNGEVYNYTRKHGVTFSKVFLPSVAPSRFNDRSTLWNEVERFELAVRKDSQFARQWEASFPPEFSYDDRLEMLTKFVEDYFVSQGMIADVNMHEVLDRNDEPNNHVHVLLTLRRVDEKGFTGNKERSWNTFHQQRNGVANLWRVAWAERCNEIYKKMDLPQRIDPRSYEIQNNGLEPTKPIGKIANQLEKRGIRTKAGNENRAIMERNKKVMQNTLYDVTISQENQALNDVEQSIEPDEKETAAVTEAERAKMEAELRAEIKKMRAEIEDLTEYRQLFDEIQEKIAYHQSQGNTKAVSQLEQSKLEASLRLQEEHGRVDYNLTSNLMISQEQLKALEEYLEALPDIENNPNGDRSNIVELPFDREQDSRSLEEIEAELEAEREREKER